MHASEQMASATHEPPAPECVLRGHAADVTAARFGSGGHWHDESGLPRLISASADGELRIWSLQTRRPVAKVAAHPDKSVLTVQSLAGGRVLTQGRDGFVHVWDAHEGEIRGPVLTLRSASYNFCQCACNGTLATRWTGEAVEGEAAPLLAMANEDAQQVHIWDIRQPNAPAFVYAPSEAHGKAGMCMCTRFAQRGQLLLAGWEDGSLQCFDLRRFEGVGRPDESGVVKLHSEPLLCIEMGPTGQHALSGSADCSLCVTPIAGGCLGKPDVKLQIPITNEASGSGGIATVCMRPDGRVFATGGWDRRVRIWQWRGHKPLAVLTQHTGTVNAVSFSDDSKWLASASSDSTIALWTLFPPKGKEEKPKGP